MTVSGVIGYCADPSQVQTFKLWMFGEANRTFFANQSGLYRSEFVIGDIHADLGCYGAQHELYQVCLKVQNRPDIWRPLVEDPHQEYKRLFDDIEWRALCGSSQSFRQFWETGDLKILGRIVLIPDVGAVISRLVQPSSSNANREKPTFLLKWDPDHLQVTATNPQAEVPKKPRTEHDCMVALLSLYTNGISDDRIQEAARVLADDNLTVNEKLTRIHELMPIPSNASAEQLGKTLRVSKTAIIKTEWWQQNRKGEKENEIARREEIHYRRSRSYEALRQDD
jgi:putative ubiquitin-RnfH superfamily antitoxin RatB of RatAB toxin-antitoxin module